MKLFLFIEIIYFFLYKKDLFLFQFIENVHDVLQFLFIAEWDADFPLPLAEQVNCTLVLRNLESFSLSMVNSSGICVLAVMVFLPLSTSSPLFSRCTISSTFLTE